MLIQADAAGLEWRVLAELAQDEVAIGEISNKEDTHSKNQTTFELPSRLIAKIYLFRTIYRGSGWSFANDASFSHVSSDPKYWDEVNVKFYTKYFGIDNKHQEWSQLVLHGKPIWGPLGTYWPIDLGRDKRGDVYLPWTKFTNYPVQGTGADLMMMARIIFRNRLVKKSWGHRVLLVSTVHDSICVDAPSELLQEICDLFHQTFDALIPNIRKIFGYEWRTPMTCEVKFGNDMKNMTKIDRND